MAMTRESGAIMIELVVLGAGDASPIQHERSLHCAVQHRSPSELAAGGDDWRRFATFQGGLEPLLWLERNRKQRSAWALRRGAPVRWLGDDQDAHRDILSFARAGLGCGSPPVPTGRNHLRGHGP